MSKDTNKKQDAAKKEDKKGDKKSSVANLTACVNHNGNCADCYNYGKVCK